MADHRPQVSVLIPSYQKAAFLSDAIQSVLDQRDVDLELLIYDDASADDSPSIIQSFQDPRIRYWLASENRGVVYAMNLMIGQAKGSYIAFLGADDCFEPRKLEKQVHHLETHPAHAAVFTHASIIDEQGKSLTHHATLDVAVFAEENKSRESWIRYLLLHGNHFCHSSVLVRREVFMEIGLYAEQYLQLHDYEFWLRMLLKYEIHVIPENLTRYRRCVSAARQCLSGIEKEQTTRVLNETSQIASEVFDRMDIRLLLEVFPESKTGWAELDRNNETSMEAIRFQKIRTLSSLSMPAGCQVMAGQMLANQWMKDASFIVWLTQDTERWKELWAMTGKAAVCYPIGRCSAEAMALSISSRKLMQIILAKMKHLIKKKG